MPQPRFIQFIAALCAALSAGLSAASVSAEGAVILDYRQSAPASLSLATAEEIAEALDLVDGFDPQARQLLGPDPLFLGYVDGSFTAPGVQQGAWLFSNAGPIIANPQQDPAMPLLVVVDAAAGVVTVARPDPVRSHIALLAATDPDGDGIDVLLLEGGYMNMGITEIWVDAVQLRDGVPAVSATWPALTDSCGQSLGPAGRTASVFVLRDGAVVVEETALPCSTY